MEYIEGTLSIPSTVMRLEFPSPNSNEPASGVVPEGLKFETAGFKSYIIL